MSVISELHSTIKLLTIDRSVSGNAHHAASNILLLAKLNTLLDEPLLIMSRTDGALDPTRCNISYTNSLFVTRPSNNFSKSMEGILCCSIFPVSL